MAFSSCQKTTEDAFPPTHFRAFIDSVLGANAAGKRVIERPALILSSESVPLAAMQHSARQDITTARRLLAERRDLDAHYGWVLASDAELVYKSMGGKSSTGAAWARQWLNKVFEEYDQIGQSLSDTVMRLHGCTERTEGYW